MLDLERRQAHELHHKKYGWVFYATLSLGFWLIASPSTYGYQVQAMVWNDLLAGFLVIILSYFAMHPYKMWAPWALILLGIWLLFAPMVFWAREGAAMLNDYMVGTLIVMFAIIIPGQPGIKLFERKGYNVPAGWNYNPSSWDQRVPVVFMAWIGFFVARYMAAYQMGYIDSAWDPFFKNGTEKVLTSEVSRAFPVSDALLGAFSYLFDILFALAGNTHRWRTMPWVVIVFGILIFPLGVVSITLVILQPLSVGYWCTLCLVSALVSLIMIPFTLDEVLATIQLMKHEKRKRNRSYWNTFWFGGTMEEGYMEKVKDPKNLLGITLKESKNDLLLRPWNLFVIMIMGVWIMASPGILGFSGSIEDNSYVTGALIITFAVIAMSEVSRSLRFVNMLLALWLIIAPWILEGDFVSAKWNGIISGILIILLSIRKGKIEDKRGNFENYIV